MGIDVNSRSSDEENDYKNCGLLSRFNAASLATTTMYNTISNGLIPSSVRSLHDQVARVNNYYSKSAI